MLRLDMPTCVSCSACERICPNKTISMVEVLVENGKRLMPQVGIERCLFCGLCEEVCPTKCLSLTKGYDFEQHDRRNFVKRRRNWRDDMIFALTIALALTAIASRGLHVPEQANGVFYPVFRIRVRGQLAALPLIGQEFLALLQFLFFACGLSACLISALSAEGKAERTIGIARFSAASVAIAAPLLYVAMTATVGAASSHAFDFAQYASGAIGVYYMFVYALVTLLFAGVIGGMLVVKRAGRVIA